MTWLVIDAILLMLVCFGLGCLLAWLLAVALFPARNEAFTDLDVVEDDE